MVPMSEGVNNANLRLGSPSSTAWLYLLAEFFIGIFFSSILAILGIIKYILPKPPRDLRGNVALVTGATSSLGRCLAEEFIRVGCTLICVDNDLDSVKSMACELMENYSAIQNVGPNHRKQDMSEFKVKVFAYQCDLWDRNAIREVAEKIKKDVRRIDILVTCAGNLQQDVFDIVSMTLMSHYWTLLTFLPSMIQQERAHIVGITPTTSTDDAYMGTKAAIAGLMESLSHEFSHCGGHLNFITVAPKADPRLIKQNEKQVALDVVRAVRRDQFYLSASWWSTMMYHINCTIHMTIITITRWINAQGCYEFF
ncbi:retinol dehydrogenase 10-B-like [Chelonus insularis]|uniref:retinol dehydrogenase 10-B-like n=1 Tax=Chelonus insularis TaxID=460826 RepID=UPI00158AAD67|nr:retinol dehydrogenase 10-B-like [Chelonus insularis]